MNIHQESSVEEAKKTLSRCLSLELARLRHERIPTLLLFSGGSALSIFDALDAENIDDFLTMAPIDERYDPTRKESNFAAFMRTDFYKRAQGAGVHFIDTRVQKGQTRDALADFFEKSLREWRKRHKEGNILAILGMGADGHTMGVFPGEKQEFDGRFNSEKIIVGYRAEEAAVCPERITATLSFMRNSVDGVFVFLVGKEKEEAWNRVKSDTEPLHILPMSMIHSLRKVEIFTDLRYNTNTLSSDSVHNQL